MVGGLLAFLLLVTSSATAAWVVHGVARPIRMRGAHADVAMQNLGDLAGDMGDLQKDLKRAAAQKLGANLQDLQSPEDLSTSQAGANSFAEALAAKKSELEKRKAEIGEEAALAELDASIRNVSSDGTTTRAWVVGDPDETIQ